MKLQRNYYKCDHEFIKCVYVGTIDGIEHIQFCKFFKIDALFVQVNI